MPEKTQQFAQNIAKSLIGEEAAHPAQPLIQMQASARATTSASRTSWKFCTVST